MINRSFIHENGHAESILGILDLHKGESAYALDLKPIILLGNYKKANAKPYKICSSEKAHFLYYPPKIGLKGLYIKFDHIGLTLHPCMDVMTNDEIQKCAPAGYEAEKEHFKNIERINQDYLNSSDYEYFLNPGKFKRCAPAGYATFKDAYMYYYSTFVTLSS